MFDVLKLVRKPEEGSLMLDQAWESKGEESQKRHETLLNQSTSVRARHQSLLRFTLNFQLTFLQS
jgi:hypothetical protein